MSKAIWLENLPHDNGNPALQESQGSYLKVFISWSGLRSHGIARQLGKWLPYIIQAIKPFVSSGISKGARWSDVLAEELKETQYGIICITRQNIMSPWLNFEAGALSKMIGQSYVSPVLFGVDPSHLRGPISQFQATVFDEHGEDIFGLITSINSSLPIRQQVSPDVLRNTFEKWWPDLQKDIAEAANERTSETGTPYEWLYTVADLISTEDNMSPQDNKKWDSVWVINPNPFKDWSLLRTTVQKNMEQGVEYEFVVPSDQVEEFRRFVKSDLKRIADNADSRTKLLIGCVEPERFKSLAVTHYRILNSTKAGRKVLFEVPIGSCGYWVDTEGEAVDGFYSRFLKMKIDAECQPIFDSTQPATSRDQVVSGLGVADPTRA